MEEELERLRAENARLREALEFYANEKDVVFLNRADGTVRPAFFRAKKALEKK